MNTAHATTIIRPLPGGAATCAAVVGSASTCALVRVTDTACTRLAPPPPPLMNGTPLRPRPDTTPVTALPAVDQRQLTPPCRARSAPRTRHTARRRNSPP